LEEAIVAKIQQAAQLHVDETSKRAVAAAPAFDAIWAMSSTPHPSHCHFFYYSLVINWVESGR
jgi:hypothetical protein